jgi:transposase-like protein
MTARLALLLSAVAVAYAVWAYTHPYRDCPRCKGTGRNRLSTSRRRGRCWRCKGTREIKTLGSRALHKLVRRTTRAIRSRREK